MSISFEIPSFTILSIIIYQLRIFEGLCLILWTKSLKKKGMRSQNVNSLFIMGIILTIFSGISLWLPNHSRSVFPSIFS
jgi:pilus assembly protein TadC